MPWIQMRDLMELAAADDEGSIAPLTQVFEWRHARLMGVAKGAAAFSATLIVGVALGFLQDELELAVDFRTAVLAAGILTSLGAAAVFFLLASRSTQAYLSAIAFFTEFGRIRPFLRRYMRR